MIRHGPVESFSRNFRRFVDSPPDPFVIHGTRGDSGYPTRPGGERPLTVDLRRKSFRLETSPVQSIPNKEIAMADYLLLLYDNALDFSEMSPEDMQKIIERYKAWGDSLEASGKLIGSNKLVDEEGRVLRPEQGKVRVIDGPYSESKEVIGGYFAIRAADYDEAVEISRSCPHLEYEGTIEIREIDTHH